VLSEGALCAHVLERETVCWGSLSAASRLSRPFMEAMQRAASALELCQDGELGAVGAPFAGLQSFVMVESAEGFHVGTRVRGTMRTFLMFTFAAGSSYGSSIASLSVGAESLARQLAAGHALR
jgi:hypothetical protein